MKLRNKNTGEIIEKFPGVFVVNSGERIMHYNSLTALNEEWEDVSTEEVWYLGERIGNYSMPKKEARKATEKILAWERLKNKGFRFKTDSLDICCHTINFKVDRQFDMTDETSRDLHLLFGGEE